MRRLNTIRKNHVFLFPLYAILLIAALTMSAGTATAVEYYVDITSGNDILPPAGGTQANPWKTLHYAVSNLSAGDNLHIAAGTYSVANGETNGPLVLDRNNLTIEGAEGGGTIIDGTGAVSWADGFGTSAGLDSLFFADLEIRNFSDGLLLEGVTNTTVQYCDFNNNTNGIYLNSCNNTNTIQKCKIIDNDTGLYINSASLVCSPEIINNLIIEEIPTAMIDGIIINGGGTSGTASPTIHHNTIDGGLGNGISMEQFPGVTVSPDIRYNIITGFDTGIMITGGSPTPTLDYNDVYGNVANNYLGPPPGTNSISQDPQFTDPGILDYHLPNISPCVDVIPSSEGDPVTDDLDGSSRPLGEGWDIGCYEHLPFPDGNLPPEPPEHVSPAAFRVFAPGQPVTLRASAFIDPEGDEHTATRWLIGRADRDVFRCADYPPSFEHESSVDLTEYTIPAADLVPGMAYFWVVGYQDSGSWQFTMSSGPDEEYDPTVLEPNIFVIGETETDLAPPINAGTTVASYRMMSSHHIPVNPLASAVIGDDLGGPYSPSQYRIGVYDNELNGGSYREYPDFDIYPGGAAWFLARNGLTVDMTGVRMSTVIDVDNNLMYNKDNGNGWNMIGPPNDRNYLWSDIEVIIYDHEGVILFGPERIANLAAGNPYIDPRLWEWENGQYTTVNTMTSGHGYWVNVRAPGVNLRFTVGAQATLANPDVLLAMGVETVKQAIRKNFSPATAIADNDGDSPPEPMGSIATGDDSDSSSVDVSCFVSSLSAK